MKTLARPDTLYAWAHCHWIPAIAVEITLALARIQTPGSRHVQARIDALIAGSDPLEQERLRSLPWPELMDLLKTFEEDGFEPIPETVVEVAGRHFAMVAWSPRRGCNFQLQANGATLHGNT